MAFNNSNRNKNQRVNTTTRLDQLYNEHAGEDSSTLRLGLWNDYATLNINPMLPKNEQVDGKMYNYEQTAGVVLTLDAIMQIRTGIKLVEKTVSGQETKKPINNFAVRGNGGIICKIGGPNDYEDINSYYLALISFDDNNNLDGTAFYIFESEKDNTLMLNFDEDANTFKNRKINTQWERFKAFIDYCADNIINGACHGANKNMDYHFSKLFSVIDTIKALVENLVTGNGGSSSSSDSGNSSFGRNGFRSSKRRRSNVTLTEDDVEDDDNEEDFMHIDPDSPDEVLFDDDEPATKKKKSSSKTSSSKSSKKSSKSTKTSAKSSKKLALDQIADDMEDDELDDMNDID